tara:strand:+ start:3348 stop:3593 length:246 start_codon:yes stop_codon:yes gene_type:complete
MSLKDKVDAMRIVTKVKSCRHGYQLTDVVPVLFRYIDQLEAELAAPKPAKKAPAKKAPAKKAPAKKAPAKKAPAKKKTAKK